MKRRTLDLIVSAGGLVLAGLLLIAGLVLTSNANFARTYVHDQLSQQKIFFKTADTLTAEEKQQACLVTYAGQPLTTGAQAECYANNFINVHLQGIAGGKTYAELGDVQTQLKAQIADAQKTNAPNLADLQKQLTDTNTNRETVFKGETLRGLLLTSDRKSTRLNSSHVRISYAVFCLKKKKRHPACLYVLKKNKKHSQNKH